MFAELFGKKTVLWSSQLWNGRTDSHSHILPGVDDGIGSLEESLRVLAQYEEWGVKHVWCTPHIMEDIPNRTDELKARFEELKQAFKGGLQLHLAAEYMMDSLFLERLNEKDLLPIGERGEMLLVETSCFNPPAGFELLLKNVQSAGFHPLLAHPERYAYMKEENYVKLKNSGVRFQLNVGSLGGIYGDAVKKKAEWLLKRGLYDRIGSDLHAYRMTENPAKVKKKTIDQVLSIEKQGAE